MPNSFTQIFGGITVYPSDIGFIDYTLTQSATFVWATLGETSTSTSNKVIASFTRITASGSGIVATLPDADNASVGNALRFKNNGATTFNIASASGSVIATMSAGQDILLSITDNTTTGGTWDASYIGSGTTSANASALAGAGLTVSGGQLITNWPVDTTGSSGYQLTTTSVGRLISWTGGEGTVVVGFDLGTVRDGFFTAVKNDGTGILTLSGGAFGTVDGSTVDLYPGDSTFLIGDGLVDGYKTVGLTNANAAGYIEIDMNTSATYTLPSNQSRNKIFKVTNPPAAVATQLSVTFPQTPAQFTVINSLNGSPIVTASNYGYVQIKTSAANAEVVNVFIGAQRDIICDGTNMYFADDMSQRAPARNITYWADFSKNPWQRGTSFTSSSVAAYTADRVSVLSPSGASYTVTRVASSTTGCESDMRIQRISGSPTASGLVYAGFALTTSESIALRGKQLSLAVQGTFGSGLLQLGSQFYIATSTGTDQNIVSTISNWTLGALVPTGNQSTGTSYFRTTTLESAGAASTIPTTVSQIAVLYRYTPTTTANSAEYIDISRIALVAGTFSSFEDSPPVDITNRCLSFAYAPTASAIGQTFGGGQAVSANQAVVPIQFPTTMFKAPSLSAGATTVQLTNSVNAALTVSSISISGANSFGAELVLTASSSALVAGHATRLQAATSTSKMVFSADL